MELRAAVHHLGDIVAAGADGEDSEDGSSADSGIADFTGYGIHGMAGRGGGGGKGRGGGGGGGEWAHHGSDDESAEWGVEYAWSAQGGAGRHQAPTLVQRMPQAICTNYLRVRKTRVTARGNAHACAGGIICSVLLSLVFRSSFASIALMRAIVFFFFFCVSATFTCGFRVY